MTVIKTVEAGPFKVEIEYDVCFSDPDFEADSGIGPDDYEAFQIAILSPSGEVVDTLAGIVGDIDDAEREARRIVEHEIDDEVVGRARLLLKIHQGTLDVYAIVEGAKAIIARADELTASDLADDCRAYWEDLEDRAFALLATLAERDDPRTAS